MEEILATPGAAIWYLTPTVPNSIPSERCFTKLKANREGRALPVDRHALAVARRAGNAGRADRRRVPQTTFGHCGVTQAAQTIMKTVLVLCAVRRRDAVGGNRGEVPRRLGPVHGG